MNNTAANRLNNFVTVIYWLAGAVVYFGTSAYFFADGRVFLGLIMLLVPPAGVILPWFAATWLGVVSVVGIVALVIAGKIDR